jgi:hypothetical protein
MNTKFLLLGLCTRGLSFVSFFGTQSPSLHTTHPNSLSKQICNIFFIQNSTREKNHHAIPEEKADQDVYLYWGTLGNSTA